MPPSLSGPAETIQNNVRGGTIETWPKGGPNFSQAKGYYHAGIPRKKVEIGKENTERQGQGIPPWEILGGIIFSQFLDFVYPPSLNSHQAVMSVAK